MTKGVVSLGKRYGKKYRVKYEESRQAEYGKVIRTKDPWLMILLCLNGHICPWGGLLLAACTKRSGGIAKQLMRLPFVDHQQSQVGSDGVNAVFHVEHLDEVLRIMKPRRRRQLTEEQKVELAERLRIARAKIKKPALSVRKHT